MKYHWIDRYCLEKPAATKDFKVEWKWERYQVGGRLFAAICCDAQKRPIITLKCDPVYAQALREQYLEIVPGYYTDKRNWNSISLTGNVPDELMREMIDMSYQLVVEKLTKKRRRELGI